MYAYEMPKVFQDLNFSLRANVMQILGSVLVRRTLVTARSQCTL